MFKIVDAQINKKDLSLGNPVVKTSIFAGNGIFERKKSWLGYSVKKVAEYELGDEYPSAEETLEIDTVKEFPKLPIEAIKTVIAWYKHVDEINGQEAQINFYKTKNNQDLSINIDEESKQLSELDGITFWTDEIFSYTPIQNNSSALTSVSPNDTIYDELNKKFGLYIETHSHNSMSAFRSGTDEKYSYNDGIQLVFGKLNTDVPEMYSWICIRGLQRAGLSMEELTHFIDFPKGSYYETETNKVLFDLKTISLEGYYDSDLLEKWDSQVEIKKQTYKQTSYLDYTSKWEDTKVGSNKWDYSDKYGSYYYSSLDDKLILAEEAARNEIMEKGLSNIVPPAAIELILSAFVAGAGITSYTSKSIDHIKDMMLDAIENIADAL